MGRTSPRSSSSNIPIGPKRTKLYERSKEDLAESGKIGHEFFTRSTLQRYRYRSVRIGVPILAGKIGHEISKGPTLQRYFCCPARIGLPISYCFDAPLVSVGGQACFDRVA
jgi:hypothetical protein